MRTLISLLCVAILAGCATRPLGKLPQEPSEFTGDLEALKVAYPEIQAHEAGVLRQRTCVPIADLVSRWGTPDEVKTVWFQLPLLTLPFVLFPPGGIVAAGVGVVVQPVQPKQYVWRRGAIEIEVYVRRAIFCGYLEELGYWEWSAVQTKDHLAK